MKKPRLTEEERLRIENGLHTRKSVYAIAKELGRPATRRCSSLAPFFGVLRLSRVGLRRLGLITLLI